MKNLCQKPRLAVQARTAALGHHQQRVSSRMPAPRAAAATGEATGSAPAAVAAEKAQGRNLVVAIDHTEAAWSAVKWTLDNLYRDGDVLHFLHVVPQGFSSVQAPTIHLYQPPLDEDCQDQVAEHAHAFIQRTFVVLAAQHNAKCEIDLVKSGCREAVGAAICKKSAALAAAAVVVPGSKKNLLEELFSGGSVARHVSAHCKQPTIILH